MEIDEGFAVGMSPAELSAEQLLSKLWLWEGKAERYGWGSNSTQDPADPACILRGALYPAFIRQPHYPTTRAFSACPADQFAGIALGFCQGVTVTVKLTERW